MQTLLTIAIPTYNRAEYLRLCLDHIFRQVSGWKELIEIIISDNCSTDDTPLVVESYRGGGHEFRYVRNEENIGADGNFAQCFALATGKYVLLFGDDDILLNGAITRIVEVLKAGDYGLVYLNSYGFTTDYAREMPSQNTTATSIYQDPATFIDRVNYWITFASGNIINKSLIPPDFDGNEFIGTHLVQLKWVLTALFAARENAVVEEYSVAFRTANTGGYRLCEVFGTNMNTIFNTFVSRGFPRSYFDVIQSKLVKTFFPNLILIQRRQSSGFSFESEDYFRALHSVFSRFPSFWLVTVPVLKLPLRLAKVWTMLVARFFT
jgi:glycosyltransferase involved in cell wall biosynthesis